MSVQTQGNQPHHIIQIMCVMNQLHRLALHQASLPPGLAGLSVSQLAVLGYLSFQRKAEIYQRDLENFFKLRRSTLSSLLNTLEKKDILYRSSVPHDARLKRLVLTPRGEKLGGLVQAHFLSMNAVLIQGLTQREQQDLEAILAKIATNLSASV